MLWFSFTKGLNIHYYLGVYFSENVNIVSNTKLSNYYLNTPSIDTGELNNMHAFNLGKLFGDEILEILQKHCTCEA